MPMQSDHPCGSKRFGEHLTPEQIQQAISMGIPIVNDLFATIRQDMIKGGTINGGSPEDALNGAYCDIREIIYFLTDFGFGVGLYAKYNQGGNTPPNVTLYALAVDHINGLNALAEAHADDDAPTVSDKMIKESPANDNRSLISDLKFVSTGTATSPERPSDDDLAEHYEGIKKQVKEDPYNLAMAQVLAHQNAGISAVKSANEIDQLQADMRTMGAALEELQA